MELDRQLPLHPGKSLVDIILDRLGEIGRDAWNGRERFGHSRHEFRLVPTLRRPLGARLEPDVEFEVVESFRVRAVIGRTELGHHDADLRERKQSLPDFASVRSNCLHRDPNGKLDTDPDVALVELRQEFLSKQREYEKGDSEQTGRAQYREDRPTQAPSDGGPIERAERSEHRTLTLRRRPTKE